MPYCDVRVIQSGYTCNQELTQQISGSCSSFTIKLNPQSNAIGSFEIFLNDVFYAEVSRQDFLNGITIP